MQKTTLSTLKSHFGPDEIKKKLNVRRVREAKRIRAAQVQDTALYIKD